MIMNVDEAKGFLAGIQCVRAESQAWLELFKKYDREDRNNERAVAQAITTALIDLANRMSDALEKAST